MQLDKLNLLLAHLLLASLNSLLAALFLQFHFDLHVHFLFALDFFLSLALDLVLFSLDSCEFHLLLDPIGVSRVLCLFLGVVGLSREKLVAGLFLRRTWVFVFKDAIQTAQGH